jgi:hypothetical protein
MVNYFRVPALLVQEVPQTVSLTHIYVYLFLGVLVALFPKDAALFPTWFVLQVKLHYVNARCFFAAYFMYRKLAKDFKAQGWPAPPFTFVPVWDRKLP